MNPTKNLLRFGFKDSSLVRRAFEFSNSQPKLNELIEKLKKIENLHHSGMRKSTNTEDIRQIYRHFIQASKTGTLRTDFIKPSSIRKLAWALTYAENQSPYDQSIVDNAGRLKKALELIETHYSINALLGVYDALLKVWDSKNAGMLRTFVRKQLTNYNGRRRFIKKLKLNSAWYCNEDGARQLAGSLHRNQENIADIWTYLELPDHMHGYRYFSNVAEAYVTLNNRLGRPFVEDIVRFVEVNHDDKSSRYILTKLIEKLGSDASVNHRQPVQSFGLREWQDPRISGSEIRWRDVSENAQRIFTQWITAEDLRLFFDVVAKACADEKFAYRKEFWMAYLEHITFCRPVLRNDVENIIRSDRQILEYYKTRRPATLKGSAPDQHAFIIQMKNYTFVEFSTAGACYVYSDNSRPFGLGDSEYFMTRLRNSRQAAHRLIHSNSEGYYWQSQFEDWIRWHLRIAPKGGGF